MTIIVPDPGAEIISEERMHNYDTLISWENFGKIEAIIRETREDIKWATEVIAHGECVQPGQYGKFKDIWSIPANMITSENGLRSYWEQAWRPSPDSPDFDESEEHRGQSLAQIMKTFRDLLVSRLEYLEEIIHQEKVRIFWNGNMDNPIRQGGAGDCYFLAALDALKGNPKGQRAITKNIRFNEKTGQWYVKFQGDQQQRIMPITKKHLEEMQRAGKAMHKGALGDQILERAYARLEDKRDKGVLDGEYSGVTVRAGSQMTFEGGWAQNVFRDICGDEDICAYRHDANIADVHFGNEYRDKVFVGSTLGPHELKSLAGNGEIKFKGWGNMRKITQWIEKLNAGDTKHSEHIEYYIHDINGRQHSLHACHAYSVKQVNKKDGWVEIANPHDTSPGKRIKISYQTFKKAFKFLYAANFENVKTLDKNEFHVDHAIRLAAPPLRPTEPEPA